MKLSLSMIVKNEERFLPGCLESVAGLVDEIVVADTGSTDRTKEIAAGFGANIIDFPWCDDFSAARNESLRHTTGDWILYLDADERIDPLFHDRIRRLISGKKADAFLLNLKSRIGTGESAQYHLVAYPRLFRKIGGVKFSGKVHEQITPSLTEMHAKILPTDVIVEHIGYAQSDDVIIAKARRNKTLLLAQVEDRQNYGYALYQLGQTEIVLGEVDKGLSHLEEALAAGGFGKSVEGSIHGIIAENRMKRENYEGALAACDDSLAAAPGQAFSRILKGDIYMKLARYREAEEAFSDALRRYESGILSGKMASAIEPVFEVHILYARLARAASLSGDDKTARDYFLKCARQKTTAANVASLFEFLLKHKFYSDAFDAAAEFRVFENEDWYLRLVSSAHIDSGRFAEAADMLGRISAHDRISMSSLANCRMKTGDFAGSESAFIDAIRLGYDDPAGLELLGLVQFRLLKFREAYQTLSTVVSADPGNDRALKFMQAAKSQLGALTSPG